MLGSIKCRVQGLGVPASQHYSWTPSLPPPGFIRPPPGQAKQPQAVGRRDHFQKGTQFLGKRDPRRVPESRHFSWTLCLPPPGQVRQPQEGFTEIMDFSLAVNAPTLQLKFKAVALTKPLCVYLHWG